MATNQYEAPEYTILRIPTGSTRLTDLVSKYRTTKLAALKAEPAGFAAKYADEVRHPDSLWQQRLAAPSTIIICVATAPGSKPSSTTTSAEDVLLSGDWVGMITIRGPLPYSIFHLPESGQPIPANPSLETRWHLCSLYTSPVHRGRGIAKKLVNASIEAAREQTRALENGKALKARIRLFHGAQATFLVDMYEAMGFEEAGKITLKEAFAANGDGEVVPKDTESTKELREAWEVRRNHAMEQVVDP